MTRARTTTTLTDGGEFPSWTLKMQIMPFEGRVTEPVLQRAFQYWRNVGQSLGDRVRNGVRAGQS